MKTLYLDTFSGISGDMMLGLLVDLGVSLDLIREQLATLPLDGYELTSRVEERHGIGGTRVEVRCDTPQPHRTWRDIDAMLETAPLSDAVKQLARRIFLTLGEAEAKVHRVPLEEVHFHEVGAVDAIVDIVGTVIGLQQLGPDRVLCAPLPLSSGLIRGSHGAMPLPAPATLQILCEAPVRNADCSKELVTPTGAAIAASVAEFGPFPEMTPEKIGYGVGGWQLDDRPNLLRGILGQTQSSRGLLQDTATVLETHLDDISAEWLGSLLDRLMENGALDAGFSPLQMKKNRPGVRVTVIAPPEQTEQLARLLLHESSAIGIRSYQTLRYKLRREAATLSTPLGEAAIKLIYDGDTLLRITPEHASCEQLAKASGKPLPEVYRVVTGAANRRYGLED